MRLVPRTFKQWPAGAGTFSYAVRGKTTHDDEGESKDDKAYLDKGLKLQRLTEEGGVTYLERAALHLHKKNGAMQWIGSLARRAVVSDAKARAWVNGEAGERRG